MNILEILKSKLLDLGFGNKDDQIFYIAGSQSLPEPLSPEEEENALEKLSKNDINGRQTLVEHNLRLVVYIAKKFENTGIGIEDLVSIGTIGLMKAINTFNTDKNIKSGGNYIYTVRAYNGNNISSYISGGIATKYLSAPELAKIKRTVIFLKPKG